MLNFGKLIESDKNIIFYMYDGNELTLTKTEKTITLKYRGFEITVNTMDSLENWQNLYSKYAFKQRRN